MGTAQGLDALAPQLPYQSARPSFTRHVEQLARRQSHRRGVRAPGVEEKSRIIDGPSPCLFNPFRRPLALETRPGVDIAGGNAIGRQRGPFLDCFGKGGFIEF